MIAFVVPGVPQGKGRPRVGKRGAHVVMFTPAKTVNYENLVAHSAHVAMAGGPVIDAAVSVRMFVGCPIPASWSLKKQAQAEAGLILPTTKPDTDNVVKAIFDACNGVVWRDDVQAVDLSLRKRYSRSPCVKVWIEPIPLNQPQESLIP